MSRPKGSLNKPKDIPSVPESTFSAAPFIPKPEIHYDLIIGIRGHRTGIWQGKNLWELVKLDDKMNRTVWIDASDRKSIINYVVSRIGKIVVISNAVA